MSVRVETKSKYQELLDTFRNKFETLEVTLLVNLFLNSYVQIKYQLKNYDKMT